MNLGERESQAKEIPPQGKAVHNRDVTPRQSPAEWGIAPLTENAQLWSAFEVYEKRAVKLKARYSLLGKLCVISIGFSAIYAAFRWVAGDLVLYGALDLPVIVIGVIGVCLDLYLRLSHLKRRWLLNRFAAERLRSAKFQAYAFAAIATDQSDLQKMVKKHTEGAIEALERELRFPNAVLDTFSPKDALLVGKEVIGRPPAAGQNREILQAAIADFRTWRTEYQHDFANNMKGELVGRNRVYTSMSDGLFFIGAVAVVVTLIVRFALGISGAPTTPASFLDWLEATAITLFIATAIAGALSVGAANTLNESRYHQYERETARLLLRGPQTASQFVALVCEMELLALEELDDFWRDSWISSYL